MRRIVLTALASMLAFPAHAQSAADFYKGKSVALAISFSPGGGYDLYARTLARHMGKHIPGNPHDRAAEHARRRRTCASRSIILQAAPKDGLTFGTFTRMAGIAPLFDPTQKYDQRQVHLARRHHRRRSASASPGTPRR